MKRFMLMVLIVILLKAPFVYANTDLSKLAGKTIYREVPAKNKTEYDESYQHKPYKLTYYNDEMMHIEEPTTFYRPTFHILSRALWDDGNWKEYPEKTIKTIEGCAGQITNKWYTGQRVWDVLKGRGTIVCTSIIDSNKSVKMNVKFDSNLFFDWCDMDTYTLSGKYKENQAQRLFPIESKSVIFELDKLFPKKETIEKLTQKGSNRYELLCIGTSTPPIQSQERLMCVALNSRETFSFIGNNSKYNCIRCGNRLKEGSSRNYYYCNDCREGFCIEKKESAVSSVRKLNGVTDYEIASSHVLCPTTYCKEYNLASMDHVVWGDKCGYILMFRRGVMSGKILAVVEYCTDESSPHYCMATDVIETIGAGCLEKSKKCFKHP